ncbi:MAG: hypothetical protein PHQ47_02890 [Candidatus Portnoybacteria bacterium]|nr:hypothetical protein [Candidatus Portnoybacteria bacterium]
MEKDSIEKAASGIHSKCQVFGAVVKNLQQYMLALAKAVGEIRQREIAGSVSYRAEEVLADLQKNDSVGQRNIGIILGLAEGEFPLMEQCFSQISENFQELKSIINGESKGWR